MTEASQPDSVVVVLATAPNSDVAAELADGLVSERLAACVSRVPGVLSRYRWQGTEEEATEVLLIIKTQASRSRALVRRLAELHPYEVPEILVLPVADGFPPYLDWVREETD